MKKVINLLAAVLITGSISAQWTLNKGISYKSAMTVEDDGATAVLTAIDGELTFWLSGLYYCDESPETVVYLYKGGAKLLDKKFKASKSTDGTSLFLDFDLGKDTTFMKSFLEAETLIIFVYESYCEDSSFAYKITNTKAAIEYLLEP